MTACGPILLSLIALFAQVACSDQGDDRQQGHVWQEQTETLDKARAVEDLLQDSAEQQRRQIEQQSQ